MILVDILVAVAVVFVSINVSKHFAGYSSRYFLAQQKAEGVQRKLVGLKMIDRGIPRHGYKLANLDGEEIGVVTSGTMSPMLKVGIALGYVKSEYATVGTTVAVIIRDRLLKAEVVKLPFV